MERKAVSSRPERFDRARRSGVVFVLVSMLACVGVTGAETMPAVLTLGQAVAAAMEQNLTIVGARSGVESAKWGARRAYANWFPKVEMTGGVTRLNDETLRLANAPIDFIRNSPGIPAEIRDNIRPSVYKDTYSTGFAVVQPIYNGGLERAGIHAARTLQTKARHELQDTEEEVILRTKSAYLSALKAEEMVKLSRETEKRTLAYLESTQRGVQAGTRRTVDVLRWEVQAAQDRENLVQATNGLAMARTALNELMGVDLDACYTLEELKIASTESPSDTLPPAQPASTAGLDPAFLSRHPAALAVGDLVALQATRLESAKSGFKPRANMAFSYSWEKNDTPALDGTSTWSTSLLVSLPVFSSFGDYASIREARADLSRARSTKEEVERQLQMRARNAELAINAALERVAAARKGIEAAQANLETVTRQYDSGVASQITVLDAATAAFSARAALIAAKYDVAIAGAELDRAIGKSRTELETQ